MNERLFALEKKIAEIAGRLSSLEATLTKGEPEKSQKPTITEESITPEVPSTPSEGAREIKETKTGGAFLAAAGMLFFFLAASFLIKLAVESGWLTPLRQLLGASLLGFSLIVAGFALKKRDMAYATFLPAAGVAIIFMCGYAGHVYYELYDSRLAVLLIAATAFLSVFLFTVFRHDIFLVTAVCGTFLVPVLIGPYRVDPMGVRVYFLFWALLYAICALSLGKRLLIGLTAYISIGLWQCLYEISGSEALEQAMLFQALQFFLLAITTAAFSVIRRSPLGAFEGWSLLPVLILFYAVEYSMASRIYPEAAPWLAIGFAAVVYGLYFLTRSILKKDRLESSPMIATFLAFAIFHSVYLEILSENLMPWFGLLIAGLALWLVKSGFSFSRFWPVYYIMWAAVLFEYVRILDISTANSINFLVLNFIVFYMIFFVYQVRESKEYASIILFLAHLQGLFGLNRLAEFATGPEQSHFLTSGMWALLALGILLFSQIKKDAILARSSMLIFALVAAKVLISDISGTGSLTRVVALVIIGALLYSGGLIWRRVGQWDRPEASSVISDPKAPRITGG